MFSGRDSICRKNTIKWLKQYVFFIDVDKHLFMREENDMRKDTIIKEELFFNHIANMYYVEAVFDDRPSVCRMWRDLGLKTYQLGDPHVEF